MIKECIHKDLCGGCIYQGIEYDEQIKIKEDFVLSLIAENNLTIKEYLGIEKAPFIYNYRNKMEYTFGDLVKDGPMTLGLHQKKRFMSVLDTDNCLIVDPDYNEIVKAVKNHALEKGYNKYNKKTHEGLLRHLVVRKGVRTKELLVNIVTTSTEPFDEDSFLNALKAIEPDLNNRIVGVLHTINNSIADTIIPEKVNLLYGRDHYKENLLGLEFHVGAFSFFQTNVEAIERLYSEAISMLSEIEDKTIYDLYCGTGTISQILAKKAKKVIGIEIVEEAVDSARNSAKLNNIENVTFIAGDVLKTVHTVSDKPDIIVVDPPRSGIHPKALREILDIGVKEILYISCNPKTMTKDLKVMEEAGYTIEKIKAYDNFPFTRHVETVVLMSRVKE